VPATTASSMARPEAPSRRVATEVSLIPDPGVFEHLVEAVGHQRDPMSREDRDSLGV
jgi:hypothetical protein